MIQDVQFFSSSSVGMGVAFGIASVLWLGFIFNDTVIEITLTLAVSYIAFFTVSVIPSLNKPILIMKWLNEDLQS